MVYDVSIEKLSLRHLDILRIIKVTEEMQGPSCLSILLIET